MLLDLKVTHFAIIDNLHLSFQPGLNIISGETGAGKSILLKGLGLLMGMKGSPDQIRTGHISAFIEGRFDLSHRKDIEQRLIDLGIETEDHQLIVRRVVSEDKSKVFLNGSLSTLGQLREVIAPLLEVTGSQAPLIEMTGQHDSRHLLSKSYHLDIIDHYGGLLELRGSYAAKYKEWKEIGDRIQLLQTKTGAQERELDYLKFQREEIVAFDPNPGEDVTLEAEVKRLKGAHKLSSYLEQSKEALGGEQDSVLSTLQRLIARGQELQNIDEDLIEPVQALDLARNQVEDALFRLERRSKDFEDSDSQLEKLEDRLSQLRKLQKKYGPSMDEIIAHLLKLETEIALLSNLEIELEELFRLRENLAVELSRRAEELHLRRVAAVKIFVQSVNDELLDLNMKGLRFSIFMERLRMANGSLALSGTGATELEFCTQTSSKDEPKPLAKYASGGELSRILLSIKRVGGMGQFPRTYLFDEVDTGVSGETAEKVGRKLRSIAAGQQVICVTHLPQVAMFAHHHFLIEKAPVNGDVTMSVTPLKAKERVQEIARLISGEKITPVSLKHASELLRQAEA